MAQAKASVSSFRGIVLETPQLDVCTRFYNTVWGLDEVPASANTDVRYFRARGSEPWVLGLADGPQKRLQCVRLGVETMADLHQLHAQLQDAGAALHGAPAALPGPGGYHGFCVNDPDGRTVEISTTQEQAPPSHRSAPAPLRASHLVLNSPQARTTVDFYVQQLGFTISDWYEGDAIVFLRCNDDHHCVGISQGSNRLLNHVAFLVDDETAVLDAGSAAARRGALPVWGPGRHGPGGNVFSYFKDPAGFVVEYTAELIQIAKGDDWQAKPWQRNPANANVWGTGGPTPLAIELMSGEPPQPVAVSGS